MQMAVVGGIAAAIVLVVIAVLIIRKKTRGRPVPSQLKPGQILPDISTRDENGNEVHSADLRGRPAVILFVRGSWCPFCSRQVADLTKHYKEINALGARLIFITPKPLDTTSRVAKFFEVEFEFWLDEELEVTGRFGLVHSKGVPTDYQGEYGDDTVWPAAIVVDRDGIIRHTWLSKMIMDRPNPEKLFQAVRSFNGPASQV